MNSLEEFSALVAKAVEALGLTAEACRQLGKAVEEQYKAYKEAYKEAYLDPMLEAANEYYNEHCIDMIETLASFASSAYIPRDPIPKTPYKPSYKTVIFDKRLKFPKCRSNCR